MYLKLRNMKKFTNKKEIDNIMGKPQSQLPNRLVYYYGKGILIAYSLKCFRVEGCKRIEYGEEGMYAVSIYYFADVEMLKEYFNLEFFDADDVEGFVDGVNDIELFYDKTFEEIKKMRLDKSHVGNYQEGENCVLKNGKMQVQNLFIMYGRYTLFFRGKSKKNKISGFQYTLCE